jgi:hypothetical protein
VSRHIAIYTCRLGFCGCLVCATQSHGTAIEMGLIVLAPVFWMLAEAYKEMQ